MKTNKDHIRFLQIDEEISKLQQEAMDILVRNVFPLPINKNLRDAVLLAANRAIENIKKDLEKKIEQIEIHCEIRENALYEIRKLVEPGSEISKIAGNALCYGNYTKQ